MSALLRRAFLEFEPLYTPEAFVATVQPESGILKRLEEGPLWVVENEHGIVGTVAVAHSAESMMVRGMAVDPEARGLKIGKALLQLTEDFARERGFDRMSLYTTAFLLSAIRLYQSSGFEFTGEKASPHGTELLRMVKILGGEIDAKAAVQLSEAKGNLVWRIFEDARFVRFLGIELISFGEGWCETRVQVAPVLEQQHGFVHAGLLMTLADHTCGGAAATVAPAGQDVITVENKVSFLRPASGPVLYCRAQVLRAGKNLIFVEAEVTTERGGEKRLVAKASSTLALIPLKPASMEQAEGLQPMQDQ